MLRMWWTLNVQIGAGAKTKFCTCNYWNARYSWTSCRRQCLKLLKHLLDKLKEKYPKDLSKFCSYHAKTMLFHACVEHVYDSDWKMEQLDLCFLRLLKDFQRRLREGFLPNFFIPTHNVLGSKCNQRSCNLLADYIDFQKTNMFLIFFEWWFGPCQILRDVPRVKCSICMYEWMIISPWQCCFFTNHVAFQGCE